ncbi:MAG: FMN-binding glutamate synthase family protein [Methanobacterium sp.]|nr:MAG: FMN-binding glutamate synthase family protein [Methanobacterium sp.]
MSDEPGNIRVNVPDSKENRQKCICRLCHSYPHDCEGEILFCSTKESECDIKAKSCLCNKCPVYIEYDLKGLYYCDKVSVGDSRILMRKKNTGEDLSFYQKVVNIKEQSKGGKSVIGSMGSLKKLPFSLDDLYLVPAQVNKFPLNQEDPVNTSIILGPESKKPLKISSPVMISGMSFGAVSKKVRLVIAKTAEKLKIAFNSGEGGLIPEEKNIGADYRIIQYSTGRFGIDEDMLKSASAVEIRFGQGAYPGKGSYLPAEKITKEIARARNLKSGEASYSPAHHPDITDHQSLKEKVVWLREITRGAPIGAKIACGDVKEDVKILSHAGVDFIALDGFGGATGATNYYIRENVGIPVFTALPLAYHTLKKMGTKDKISLIAGGGLKTSAEFTKCLSLGADAIYIGTAALIAINCQQYRVCYTGLCPTGVATQDPKLMDQLDLEQGISKLTTYLKLSAEEIANLSRIVGENDVNNLTRNNLISSSRDMSRATRVRWINGDYL